MLKDDLDLHWHHVDEQFLVCSGAAICVPNSLQAGSAERTHPALLLVTACPPIQSGSRLLYARAVDTGHPCHPHPDPWCC